MRKKSHVALALYLAEKLQLKELNRHKKAFAFGSILPDLNPGFVAEPHEFDTTWHKIKAQILEIEAAADCGIYRERMLWMRIGIVLHYLADYFTFPHNTCFQGNLKDHCVHESLQKYLLRAYLLTSESDAVFETQRESGKAICSSQELFAYIEETHEAYMRMQVHSPMNDCLWIVELCSRVMLVLSAMVCGEDADTVRMQTQAA